MQGTLWKASIVDKCTVMRDKKTADFQGHMSLPQQQYVMESKHCWQVHSHEG